eukprot:CAMPEP_0113696148 /NCGR_PEP_ID=MMETSP0038_2-20120614/21315_1 /TAXON_ID=2898 /ORGANISM="Cryptomonas paramecium" /LENGTH=180 /DNA_ID=CAMNT_0000618811 /DNA_START=6 /DNA_END=545 /DNA_ORIENTATION=- /assembly_acc=CAM_ASM_000170
MKIIRPMQVASRLGFFALGTIFGVTFSAELTALWRWVLEVVKKKQRHAKVVLLGLNKAGKTSILYQFSTGLMVPTITTRGCNIEKIPFREFIFTMKDVGGCDDMRQRWDQYIEESTDVLIYVVDASDVDRLGQSRQELERVLQSEKLKDSVLLVLANQKDPPRALPLDEISERLGLKRSP